MMSTPPNHYILSANMRTQVQNLEALSLDVFVLDSLLKQHRCSHGRAKYFQRISMTLRAIRRQKLLEFPFRVDELQKGVNAISQEQKRKRRRRETTDGEWYQKSDDKTTQEEEQLQALEGQFAGVERTLLEHVPELVSRIQLASSALFVEVSRAFFLPFCTIALGALARIRILALGMGGAALSDLHQLRGDLHEIGVGNSSLPFLAFFLSSERLEHALQFFVEQPSKKQDSSTSRRNARIKEASMMESLGLKDPGLKTATRVHAHMRAGTKKDSRLAAADMETEMKLPQDSGEVQRIRRLTVEEAETEEELDVADDDVGEAIGKLSSLGAESFTNASNSLSTSPPSTDKAPMFTSDPLDRNMTLVQEHKAKKRESKACHKIRDKAQLESSTAPQKATTKKKKKKKSKQDFFDKLFD
jgi:hypothetical protein